MPISIETKNKIMEKCPGCVFYREEASPLATCAHPIGKNDTEKTLELCDTGNIRRNNSDVVTYSVTHISPKTQ